MKFNKLLIIFVIIGCILTLGYIAKSITNSPVDNTSVTNVTLPGNETNVSFTFSPTSTPKNVISGSGRGQVLVSIGEYDAQLPVIVDNAVSGNVSKGKPLSLNLTEGIHTVKICADTVCDSLNVNVLPSMKVTVDFEERLRRIFTQGSLNVTIGNYNSTLPVYIDNISAGMVSNVKPFSQFISPGLHAVKICAINNCYTQNVNMKPSGQVSVDFGDQLNSGTLMADLIIYIGGYDAVLPAYVDNVSVGNVSPVNPLNLKVTSGIHYVKVCSGVICENAVIETKFGRPSYIDFGEQLKRDVEFPDPTVRILSASQNGNTLVVNSEFINPTRKDLTMTATISATYTFLDPETKVRTGNSVSTIQSHLVKSGERTKYQFSLYLGGGSSSSTIASDPVVIDLSTK
jgi:hypothetical protein